MQSVRPKELGESTSTAWKRQFGGDGMSTSELRITLLRNCLKSLMSELNVSPSSF